MSLPKARTKISPPQLARRYGVSADKILRWIHSGELKAMNGSTTPGGRHRYLIDEADILVFEERRAVTPSPTTRKPRPKSSQQIIEFF